MNAREIQDQIDLKRKELSITDESEKRVRLQLQIKILQYQKEIESVRNQISH